ncbi:MAG: alkaline phosphatase [Pseudomonadota bacterium]
MRSAALATALALAAALAGTPALAQDLPQAGDPWFVAGQERLQAALAQEPITTRAKNVVILIADGAGVATNYATRLFMGQQAGGFGDEHVLPHETFPHLGLVKTYNVNSQTPDSAGTATALMSGVKTDMGLIGVGAAADRGDCAALPGAEAAVAAEVFSDLGRAVGVVSTARITHATPAAAYAHSVDRDYEAHAPEGCATQDDIALQLFEAMKAGRVDVALGGGRRGFLPREATDEEGDKGRRRDGRDLIAEGRAMGWAYAWNAETAARLPADGSAPILGLFEDSHMAYEADRGDEPSLSEMAGLALKALRARSGGNGFFLQIEAGRVDHAQHRSNLARTVRDGAEFARTVALVDEMTEDEDTLIIVTADHGHSFGLNGYCGRGSNILGLCMGVNERGVKHTGEPQLARDGRPYTVAGYLNGPGSPLARGGDGARPAVTEEEAASLGYVQQALIPRGSESHSGEDVAVYAKGPWAHLLGGTLEQSYIFHVMRHAAVAGE